MLALELPPLSGYLHEQLEVPSSPGDRGSVHCRPLERNLKYFKNYPAVIARIKLEQKSYF